MQDYVKRLLLPLEGCDDIRFSTKSGLEVAIGYKRIVIGGRGPYIEFEQQHIVTASFHQIDNIKHLYYIEYRSNDKYNVKLYYQLLYVNYADYIPKRYYISPFDLISDKYPILITPLEKKK